MIVEPLREKLARERRERDERRAARAAARVPVEQQRADLAGLLIVCPHTGDAPHPETEAALLEHVPRVDFVRLHDDEDYFALLSALWSSGRDFLLVEHDIVVNAAVLPEILACPEPWCSCPYPYQLGAPASGLRADGSWLGPLIDDLGCCRFRASLTSRHPDVLARIGAWPGNPQDPAHPPRHWCSLADRLRWELQRLGERRCRHAVPVWHCDPASRGHGCKPIACCVAPPAGAS